MRHGVTILATLAMATAASGQQRSPQPDMAVQRAAIAKLAILDGAWAGTAVMTMPGAPPRTLKHTERVGPMLDGAVRVIEGRSYEADGSDAGFNALAVVSYDDQARTYAFRTYAQGHAGTFELTAPGDGFAWGYSAGPIQFRYTATVKDGRWHEEGVMIRPGAPPQRIITLDLTRVRLSDWPAAGAVTPPR